MSQDPPEKVVFPYPSLAAAAADKFEKLGGKDQAFRMLKQGYKFLAWSKRTRQRREAEQRRILAKAKAAGIDDAP